MLYQNSKIDNFLPQIPRQGRHEITQRPADYGDPQPSLSQHPTQRNIDYGEIHETDHRQEFNNYPSRRNSEAQNDSHPKSFRNDQISKAKLPPKNQKSKTAVINPKNKPLIVLLIVIIIVLILLALAGIIIAIVYGATLSNDFAFF